MDTPSGAVKSAERVAGLFELLGGVGGALRLTEIAAHLAIPKSSAHGLLQTLVSTGLVERDEHNRYRLGMKLFVLASGALAGCDIRQVARPEMEALATRIQATCNLGVLEGGDVVYIEKVQANTSTIQLVTHVGARLPAHATALGKVMLAELTASQRERWLAARELGALTPFTRTTAEDLALDLKTYRRAGFASDDEESHVGVVCYAAPVCDHTGVPVAAISVTGIKSSMAAVRPHPGQQVRATAIAISRALGAKP